MRFDFTTWEAIYEPHEMFKVNICSLISTFATLKCGYRVTVRWTPGYYGVNSNPFDRFTEYNLGIFGLTIGLDIANELIKDILHPKLLPY